MGGAIGKRPAVLYEDEWVLALDKPCGIIVHGDGTGAPTLLDAARALAPDAPGLQPLQRLDRDTSGIVLFSKRKDTQPAFDRLIAERHIGKRYLAIVAGRFPEGARTFDGAIGRDRHDSRRMRVSRTGKPARTVARRLAYAPAASGMPARSLLAVELHTGRKHQIRVHLGHAGFPILGDTLYGTAPARRATPGHAGAKQAQKPFILMLHAFEVSFTHPVTGTPVTIQAPYPARFTPLFPEPAGMR